MLLGQFLLSCNIPFVPTLCAAQLFVPLKNWPSDNKHCLLCLIMSFVSWLSKGLCWPSRWDLRSGGNKQSKVDCCWSIYTNAKSWSTAQGFTLRIGLVPLVAMKSESELELASCLWRAEFPEAEHALYAKFLTAPQVFSRDGLNCKL